MPDSFSDILLNHAARYPLWQIKDLYKLVHQAAMGNEHVVINREHTRRWLEEELASLVPTLPEPLIDPIAGDGSVVRVHLRPFTERNLPPALLLEAFLQTAEGFNRSCDTLEDYGEQAAALAREGELNVDPASLADLIQCMRKKGFPAVHHSVGYKQAYHPAYCVVARDYLPVLLKDREYF